MAIQANLDDFLASLGFDANTTYSVPDNPADAALAGVNAFVLQHDVKSPDSSKGIIHISGPSIVGNVAPVKSVGHLLADIQSAVDAIGASLLGNRSASGIIPGTITGRTEMSLVASPMPGSVVIQIAPSLARKDDLYPDGPGLFDVEEVFDAQPLADQAFTEFSNLIGELSADEPDEIALVDHLTDLGPRVASAMKVFCETVDKSSLDVEFEWIEPNKPPKNTVISHGHASYAVAVITTANIENEEVSFEGTLLTVTQSNKDKLRLLKDDGKELVIAIGDISPEDTNSLHTGDRVCVSVERRVSNKPGGKRSEKLVGKTIKLITRL